MEEMIRVKRYLEGVVSGFEGRDGYMVFDMEFGVGDEALYRGSVKSLVMVSRGEPMGGLHVRVSMVKGILGRFFINFIILN